MCFKQHLLRLLTINDLRIYMQLLWYISKHLFLCFMNGCFDVVGGEHPFNIHLRKAFTLSTIYIIKGMCITVLIYIERRSSRSYINSGKRNDVFNLLRCSLFITQIKIVYSITKCKTFKSFLNKTTWRHTYTDGCISVVFVFFYFLYIVLL